MKHKFQLKGFVLGVLVSVLVFSAVSPALAALSSKWIEVYTGVNVYVDDQLIQPKDVNGNPVEVFVYNGTTYLPIRAIGNALGKTVQWDGKTNSAYVGKHSSDKPAVWLENLSYFTGDNFASGNALKDNTGNAHTRVITGQFENTYLINGQYSAISGTLFQTYEYRSDTDHKWSIQIWGDGDLLYTATVTGGVVPVDFFVDLTGVLELKVVFDGNTYWGADMAALDNVGLWT